MCQYKGMENLTATHRPMRMAGMVQQETEMAALAVATRVDATPLEQKVWKFGHQKEYGREQLPDDAPDEVVAHFVRLRVAQRDGSLYLTCGCPGGKYAWAGDATGRGCWAMKVVRAKLHLA